MGPSEERLSRHSALTKPSCAALAVVVAAVSFSQAHAFSAVAAGGTRTSAEARTFLRPATTAASPARGSPFSRAARPAVEVLRMKAEDGFDVNAALAELRESANAAASQQKSQPLPSKLPSMPSLPTLEIPKNINIPTPTQALDALPKLHLPNLPELPTPTGGHNFLPPQLLQPSSDPTWFFSRLSEVASKASESSAAASAVASELLPMTPESYARLSAHATEAFAQTALQVSSALDALVAANPPLAPAVTHLRSSVADGVSSLGEALAAGNALIPEEYKPLAATMVIGAGATALGMAMAAAAEDGRASRDAKNAPLPREYDLPGKSCNHLSLHV